MIQKTPPRPLICFPGRTTPFLSGTEALLSVAEMAAPPVGIGLLCCEYYIYPLSCRLFVVCLTPFRSLCRSHSFIDNIAAKWSAQNELQRHVYGGFGVQFDTAWRAAIHPLRDLWDKTCPPLAGIMRDQLPIIQEAAQTFLNGVRDAIRTLTVEYPDGHPVICGYLRDKFAPAFQRALSVTKGMFVLLCASSFPFDL